MKRAFGIWVLAGCGFWYSSTELLGEEKAFVLDPGRSSLSLEGTIFGIELNEQEPGSLTTTYAGTILADVTETTVRFIGGSDITPNNSGNWQPGEGGLAGTAPANYGAAGGNILASGTAALRNLVFDVNSEAIALLNGTFAADGLEFVIPETATATADYNVSGFVTDFGSEPLGGRSTNDVLTAASITANGDQLELTIPIDYTLVLTGDVSGEFRLFGQLVGGASNATPLKLGNLTVNPGQLVFSVPTTPGKTYTILGSIDLLDFSTVVDQFVATETQTSREVAVTLVGQQFFILKEE